MAAEERQRDAGELSPRTFDDYHATWRELLSTFGKTRPVDDLRPDEEVSLAPRTDR